MPTTTPMPGYSHTQKSPLCLTVYGTAVLLLIGAWFAQEQQTAFLALAVGGIVTALLAPAFHHLTVEDQGDALVVRFGPLPLFRMTIPYDDIQAVEVGRTLFLDSWGIHYSVRGGKVWNIWGRDCVVVHTIRRSWQVKRWLLCLLEFRGRKRTVMTPNRYTELFFLDEATGLAAGHRPCFECRRDRFNAFVDAWSKDASSPPPTASIIDDQLHAERVGPNRTKQTYLGRLDELPDGVFVQRVGSPDRAYLIWRGSLLLWSPGGYRKRIPRPKDENVLVLTPRSIVGTIRAGYVPEVHSSAGKG